MIITEIGGFDHDYHYIVDGQKTSSKNQALLWAKGDRSRIHFYAQEHVWDNVNWQQEPTETIQELCKHRCRQIREQYDWVCLWLSGGYDSQTILQSFIDAGVRIDEIAYMDRSEYYDDPEIPYIIASANYYKQYYNPKVKIFRASIDYKYTKKVYDTLGEEWMLEPGCSYRPSKSIASFVQRFNNDVIKQRLSTSGRRADVYGREKPRLDLYDNKWYMAINDHVVGDSIGSDILEFYTTKDMPELHIKQCYLAIRFFESFSVCNNKFVHDVQNINSEYYQRWNLSLGRKLMDWDISRHGVLKYHFRNTVESYDSKKLSEHFSKDRSSILEMFFSTYNNLVASINDTNPTHYILSKKWYICDYGNYRNEQ